MSRFKDKLLVCDMDGTLLNSKHELSRENIKAIEWFIGNGGLFTVATGRNEFLVEKFLPELHVNVPAIIYNGACLYDFSKKAMLWERNLTNDVIKVVEGLMNSYPGLGVKVYRGGEIYLIQGNSLMEEIIQRENFTPKRVKIHEVPKPWNKVMFAWEHNSLLQVEEVLKGLNSSSRYVYSEPEVLEILNKEASKGNALKELVEIMGLTSNDVIAVGDNLNDMEMLEFAGIGIAVKNAHEGLKPFADLHCCHNDDHAVSQIIQWLEDRSIKFK